MQVRNPAYRQVLEQAFAGAGFVRDNGMRLVDCGPGWCETEVLITPHHLQHTGVPHAGVIATLADHSAGAAAMSLAGADQVVLTAEFKLSLFRAQPTAWLKCRAEIIKAGARLSFAESSVYAAGADQPVLVAKASVTLALVAAGA
jgi:uncharacterized protein (TIGR00369 family)